MSAGIHSTLLDKPTGLFSHRPFWAHRFGTAAFLPTSRDEMLELGWESCDIILVTGDAYVDHPSFGMAIVGRLLEAHGFRVGIISQPDWRSPEAFCELGRPNLMFGVTAGNMDSLVNHYTSDRKIRRDDAYTPGGKSGSRPDRAVTVYTRLCREAYDDVPVVIGGIEASLRRQAHYDYWSNEVRRSILIDSGADLLIYGNGERAIVELAHRLGRGDNIDSIRDLRGTAFVCHERPTGTRSDNRSDNRGDNDDWWEIDSTTVDKVGPIQPPPDPYAMVEASDGSAGAPACATGQGDATAAGLLGGAATELIPLSRKRRPDRTRTVIRLPSFKAVAADKALYAHASRVLHRESNPGNARALVQRHGKRDVWINPPPLPLTTPEMDQLYELPFARVPHPRYTEDIPAYKMIRFSVTIMRGCFGGCSFCSITEHEGRIIQNRSTDSVLREVERIRDVAPGFTGVISDLGGPTANMYRLACKSREIEAACRKPSCVYPGICSNLGTDHGPLIDMYRRARELPGIKKILIASGLRYDLAVESPEYVRELATHHVGGYLKIAPEHTESGPLSKMMKPGIGTYERFKTLFDRYSAQAGKEQYLIPYFIAAHPGTEDQDMLELALWLKKNGLRADQVQTFLPSPMATATTMYHSGINPLAPVKKREPVSTVKKLGQRRLHKAFLRYHDANNWPMLREALVRMGRRDLIGAGKHHLVPPWQPRGTGRAHEGRRGARGSFLTQHTGLPPAAGTDANASGRDERPAKPRRRKRRN